MIKSVEYKCGQSVAQAMHSVKENSEDNFCNKGRTSRFVNDLHYTIIR